MRRRGAGPLHHGRAAIDRGLRQALSLVGGELVRGLANVDLLLPNDIAVRILDTNDWNVFRVAIDFFNPTLNLLRV